MSLTIEFIFVLVFGVRERGLVSSESLLELVLCVGVLSRCVFVCVVSFVGLGEGLNCSLDTLGGLMVVRLEFVLVMFVLALLELFGVVRLKLFLVLLLSTMTLLVLLEVLLFVPCGLSLDAGSVESAAV